MHQARWMARAIYCLKIFLFRAQYPMQEEQKAALADVCIFIVRFYIKIRFKCSDATAAPVDDVNIIKSLKYYESIDFTTSDAALRKLSNHLWYLTEEAATLAFFDDRLSVETKVKMVSALKKPGRCDGCKKFILSSQDMGQLLGII
uniref:Uncharacterized protein n=1 Tax=Bactrocera dorsalis TaxID=27457 RepID=A0A034W6C5_BACDO